MWQDAVNVAVAGLPIQHHGHALTGSNATSSTCNSLNLSLGKRCPFGRASKCQPSNANPTLTGHCHPPSYVKYLPLLAVTAASLCSFALFPAALTAFAFAIESVEDLFDFSHPGENGAQPPQGELGVTQNVRLHSASPHNSKPMLPFFQTRQWLEKSEMEKVARKARGRYRAVEAQTWTRRKGLCQLVQIVAMSGGQQQQQQQEEEEWE